MKVVDRYNKNTFSPYMHLFVKLPHSRNLLEFRKDKSYMTFMCTCNILLFLFSLLFEILQLPHRVCGRHCYPWNLWQAARGGPGKRGVSTVQQKLPIIDDAGACVYE